MTYTTKAGGQPSPSYLIPELSSRDKRSSDVTLSLLDAASKAPPETSIPLDQPVLATPVAPAPLSGAAARESLESSYSVQSSQGAIFQKGVALPASTDVAMTGHQVLSDSMPRAATAAGSIGATCGCRACSVLAVSNGDGAAAWDTTTDQAALVMDGVVTLGTGVDLSKVFQLHSNPTATKTIFLDFDGYAISSTPWENGGGLSLKSFYTSFDATALTEIQRIWQRVAEDFAPFEVNVTTQDPGTESLRKFGSGDDRWGIRVAFTSNLNLLTGSAITNAGGGGTAYYNSFNWSTDDVALVFNRGEYTAAQTASHEVGHTLGLTHDGAGTTTEYYGGHGGTGPTSWGTLMGAPWLGNDENLTQWSNGAYTGANNTQDDLATITNGNGFTYAADDHGNGFSTATALTGLTFSSFGIIERNTDVDLFRFDTGAGLVSFNIVNASRAFIGSAGTYTTDYLAARGANLDIAATLYRADQSVVQTFNPADLTTASFSINLAAGTYYLGIDGVGFGTPLASTPTGYTDYASLGQYMVSGTVQAGSLVSMTSTLPPPLPAPTIVVTSAASLVTTEAGGSASFQVGLSRAPTSDVTIRLSSSDSTEGTVRTSTLVFTAANWQTPQTVTVQGVDDTLVDGHQAYNILMSSSSADLAFNGLGGPPVTVQNSDNDVATQPVTGLVTFQATTGGLVNSFNYIVAPTAVGTQQAIHTSDDQRLAITEGGYSTSRGTAITLDSYQWTFDNLNRATHLVFEGSRTANSNGDNFKIQFSSTGSKWTTAFTVSNTIENSFSYTLPTPVSGRMLVRVVDTKTGVGDTAYDTLFIDRLAFTGSTAAAAQRTIDDPIIGGGTSLAPDAGLPADLTFSTEPFLAGAELTSLGAATPPSSDPLVSLFPAAGSNTSPTTPWLVAPQPLV